MSDTRDDLSGIPEPTDFDRAVWRGLDKAYSLQNGETAAASLIRLLAAERRRADVAEKIVAFGCEDEDDLHTRCDAILGPEVIDPPGSGRTPLAGHDGRVAAAFAAITQRAEEAEAERDAVLTGKEDELFNVWLAKMQRKHNAQPESGWTWYEKPCDHCKEKFIFYGGDMNDLTRPDADTVTCCKCGKLNDLRDEDRGERGDGEGWKEESYPTPREQAAALAASQQRVKELEAANANLQNELDERTSLDSGREDAT